MKMRLKKWDRREMLMWMFYMNMISEMNDYVNVTHEDEMFMWILHMKMRSERNVYVNVTYEGDIRDNCLCECYTWRWYQR
jgi:hypothetical protein